MKIKPAQADTFARKPGPKVRAVLVYGPDRGLVRERAGALVRSVVDNPDDPFRVAELSAAQIAKEPALVADEAAAIAFGGGRRVVFVRGGDDGTLPAFKAFLDEPQGDSLVVVEGGDLDARSRLRQLFERSTEAGAALPCYRDDTRSLGGLIREMVQAEGMEIDRAAQDHLLANMGSDRLMTRREMEKLLLYKGSGRIELTDVQACVGDTAALSLDDLATACAEGNMSEVERTFQRAIQEDSNAVAAVRAVARHFQRLHFVSSSTDRDKAMDSLRPPVFWKQKDSFKAQARAWTAPLLKRALTDLLEAERWLKTTGVPADTLGVRALLRIAGYSPLRRKARR